MDVQEFLAENDLNEDAFLDEIQNLESNNNNNIKNNVNTIIQQQSISLPCLNNDNNDLSQLNIKKYNFGSNEIELHGKYLTLTLTLTLIYPFF